MTDTILLVEDSPFYGELLTAFLSRETSYHLWWVQTGHAALQVAEKIVPVLFLLDYRLPDIDGLTLSDRLHAIAGRETIPTLMLSSDLPDAELEARLATHNIVGLGKQSPLSTIRATLERLVADAQHHKQ
ncbi:MAG: response regulator [Chloroflexi bacterium]|nr:MAG: response regulator [Chloroflexota bacterium]